MSRTANRLDYPKIPIGHRWANSSASSPPSSWSWASWPSGLDLADRGGAPSQDAQRDIPPQLLPVYQTAADSCLGRPGRCWPPSARSRPTTPARPRPGSVRGQLRRRPGPCRSASGARPATPGRLRGRRRRRRGRRLQPGRRDLHRGQLPLPERRQQGRGCGRGGLRLQPRRLVRDQGPGHRLDLRRQPGPPRRPPRRWPPRPSSSPTTSSASPTNGAPPAAGSTTARADAGAYQNGRDRPAAPPASSGSTARGLAGVQMLPATWSSTPTTPPTRPPSTTSASTSAPAT